MQESITRVFAVTIVLWLLCAPILAQPQPQPKIEDASLTIVSNRTFSVSVKFTIALSDQFASSTEDNFGDFNPANIKIVALPSGTRLTVKAASLEPGTGNLDALIELDPGVPLAEEDKQFSICFEVLHFQNSSASPPVSEIKNPLCFSGKVIGKDELQAAFDKMKKDFSKAPKNSSEKNIFASGLVTSAAGQDSVGGGMLNLNSNDLSITGLTAFLHLKKNTTATADPKHFDIGLNYRSTFLFHRKALAEIRDLVAKKETVKANEQIENLRKAVLSSATFDFAAKFEAQALSFDVANFVGDGLVQLKSRVLPLTTKRGYFKFYGIPAGLEIGQILNKGSQMMPMSGNAQSKTEKVDWLARYKFGGGFSLFYSDKETRWLFKRIELDTQFVGRQLFRNEVMFDEKTMMNIKTTKGFKPWFETGLSAYIADTPNGRFGFRLTYNRGSLPPVFAKTDSLQYGFVFETPDDQR